MRRKVFAVCAAVAAMGALGLAGTGLATMMTGDSATFRLPKTHNNHFAQKLKKVDFSSASSIRKYLRAIGVNPNGVVVQRGARNYAGPNCPGKRWNCTRANRVVQVADAGGNNKFECTGPGTTGSPPSEPNPSASCSAVQAGDHNKFRCVERITTSSSFATENCSASQTGPDNWLEYDMRINMVANSDQTATQTCDATQVGGGHNEVHIKVRSDQTTAPTNEGSQNQEVTQHCDVNQDGPAPKNDAHIDASFGQSEFGSNLATLEQNQNASDAGPNTEMNLRQEAPGGKNDAHLDIDSKSFQLARNIAGSYSQTQGSPSGGLFGHSDQFAETGESLSLLGPASSSSGNPSSFNRLDANLDERMTQIADKKGDQTQHGPGFCCSVQLSDNPQKDKEKIRINSTLFQFPSDPQTDLILLSCHTDNPTGCDGKATATVNGASATFTCEGNASPCDGGVACDSASSETGACVPVPCTVGGEGGCPEIPPPPTTTITLLAAPPR